MLGKIAKYGIFTVFIGFTTAFIIEISKLIFIFPDYRINLLIGSCISWLIIIAIKRGVWH